MRLSQLWKRHQKSDLAALQCSKCGSTGDADVIAAIGLCQACVSRAAIDSLMQDLLKRRPFHGRVRDLPMKILVHYLHPTSPLSSHRNQAK